VAKQSGLGDNCYVAGYDLSGDIGSLSKIGGGPKPLVVTAIDKSAFERIGGIRDGGLEYMAFFNDAASQAHPRLSTLPRTDQIVTYCRGTTLGNPAAACVAKQLNYDGTRGADGSFTFTVQALANAYGLEWGRQLTAGKRTDTAATNGTGVDFTSASTFGLQAYLHVFSFVGTDATIKIQESSDNGADVYADVTGGDFTAVTVGPTSQRIATSATLAVERYLRVVTTTSAGFTSLVFSVTVMRNLTATAF
jgi:hypothetical protein